MELVKGRNLSGKKFILNADDFGMSKAFNRAVLEGYESGILMSTSLTPNGEAFEDACQNVIPACQNLGVGIHLNIIEGKSLCADLDTLTDSEGNFNNSFGQLLLKSVYSEIFLKQVEKEFRAQIEKAIAQTAITHIDSHVHTHSIPRIFEIVCKLAKEYGIKQIRTQHEKPYIIPDVFKHLNLKYPINLIKLVLLNIFTLINENTAIKYRLKTNDYLLGVTYTSMMNSLAISYGLMAIKEDNITAEALIHPCRYDDGTIDNHFEEFQITKNLKLKEKIEKIGFKITNYKDEALCEQK